MIELTATRQHKFINPTHNSVQYTDVRSTRSLLTCLITDLMDSDDTRLSDIEYRVNDSYDALLYRKSCEPFSDIYVEISGDI